jgi:flagellar assembly protein FliH
MARVIKADRESTRIVPRVELDARARAEAILRDAASDAQELRRKALQEGRREGRAELAATILEQAQAAQRRLDELEDAALQVGLEVARRLVGAELEREPQHTAALVRQLLARVRRARRVMVQLHPLDRPQVQRLLPQLLPQQGEAAVELVDDATLQPGDCVVYSDVGTLDGRIETRLSALAGALRRS